MLLGASGPQLNEEDLFFFLQIHGNFPMDSSNVSRKLVTFRKNFAAFTCSSFVPNRWQYLIEELENN